MQPILLVKKIMTEFAESSGISNVEAPPRRYLWTDAFAVCNFIGLSRQTGNETWLQTALSLVNQVHNSLARHREDDSRTGWISGLTEAEGRRHPTIGGLRIGKRINERKHGDPYDERLEWGRDGQYYHYLTKWMHALNRLSACTANPVFNIQALELAKTAHDAFVHSLPSGSKRMYWKMSIDLTYPLIASMGQQDPLDGLITYTQLRAAAAKCPEEAPDLSMEIADMAALCRSQDWSTNDPLGIGGLLGNAYKIMQLIVHDGFGGEDLLKDLLKAALRGLDSFEDGQSLNLPAEYRLAFRELGTAIGLHAVERIRGLLKKNPANFGGRHAISSLIARFDRFFRLAETIEKFWLESPNRQSRSWREHRDINRVMLATSLIPAGYLELQTKNAAHNS